MHFQERGWGTCLARLGESGGTIRSDRATAATRSLYRLPRGMLLSCFLEVLSITDAHYKVEALIRPSLVGSIFKYLSSHPHLTFIGYPHQRASQMCRYLEEQA